MDRERYLKVEGDSSFVRDKESSAIVNVDKGAWRAARAVSYTHLTLPTNREV